MYVLITYNEYVNAPIPVSWWGEMPAAGEVQAILGEQGYAPGREITPGGPGGFICGAISDGPRLAGECVLVYASGPSPLEYAAQATVIGALWKLS